MGPPAVDDIPALPGAYVLVIDLLRPLTFDSKATGLAVLAPGRYAYCGSARGPGGMRARVRRHRRRDKRRHWHIDRLTAAARIIEVKAYAGNHECDLLQALLLEPGVSVPVPGFGSTDCRRCPAHLIALPRDRTIRLGRAAFGDRGL